MIIGYMLLDSGGTLIAAKELVEIIKEGKISLFSGAITAIGNVISEVFKSKIRHLELENVHLYTAFGRKITVILVSDIEDDRLLNLTEDIVDKIEEKISDLERMIMDEKLKEELIQEVDRLIFRTPPSILSINSLAKMLIAVINLEKAKELGIIEIIPKVYKPSLLKKIKSLFTGKASIEELIKYFYKARLSEIVSKAPSLFDDERYGDLAKILYAKAALMLNSFHPLIKAPTLDEIYSIIESINDDIAREYLKAELNSFLILGAYNDRRDLFIKRQFEIFEKLSAKDHLGDVYSIMITPLPYGALLDYLENKFRNKSDLLYALTLEMKLLLKILTMSRPKASDILPIIGESLNRFKEAYEKKSLGMYSYFHMFLFSTAGSLLAMDINYEDALEFLRRVMNFFEKYYEEIVEKALYSSNRHRAVNIYFALNIFARLLLEIDDSYKEKVKDLENYAKEILKWFIGLGKTRRIMIDMYYVGVAGIISALTRFSFETGIVYKELPELILKLANPEMEKFWRFNEYHFAHYYADLLDSIGNLAAFVKIESIKKNIMVEAAYGIERIYRLFRDSPMIGDFEIIKAIRLYLLSGTETGYKRARELYEEAKGNLSPFIINVIEKTLQKIW